MPKHVTIDELNVRGVDLKILGADATEVNNAAGILQSAIDTNAPLGIWVIVPKGNYKLSAPVILKDGTKILMHKDAKLSRYHNDNIFQNGSTGDTKGYDNITILGGKLDLRGTTLKQDGTGIALGYAKNIWIRDVEIYNVYYSHGIEICAMDTVFVERCGLYGYIIDAALTRDYVEAIQVERGTSSSFPYFGPGDNTISKNVRIHYCKFGASDIAPTWPTAIGSHQDVSVPSVDNLEIIGCVSVNDLSYACIVGKGYKNVTIERNTLKAARGVLMYDGPGARANVTMRKNNIVSTVGEAVRLDGINKVSFDDNTLEGQTNGIMITGGSSGVKILDTNEISSNTSDAVCINGASNRVKCDGATIKKAGRYAFNIYEAAKQVKILNNFIIEVLGASAFDLASSGTQNIVIKGNSIEATTITNVLKSSGGPDRLYFNDNIYPASIAVPINNIATNSDMTNNKTF
jgi:hypothetical protein